MLNTLPAHVRAQLNEHANATVNDVRPQLAHTFNFQAVQQSLDRIESKADSFAHFGVDAQEEKHFFISAVANKLRIISDKKSAEWKVSAKTAALNALPAVLIGITRKVVLPYVTATEYLARAEATTAHQHAFTKTETVVGLPAIALSLGHAASALGESLESNRLHTLAKAIQQRSDEERNHRLLKMLVA